MLAYTTGKQQSSKIKEPVDCNVNLVLLRKSIPNKTPRKSRSMVVLRLCIRPSVSLKSKQISAMDVKGFPEIHCRVFKDAYCENGLSTSLRALGLKRMLCIPVSIKHRINLPLKLSATRGPLRLYCLNSACLASSFQIFRGARWSHQ